MDGTKTTTNWIIAGIVALMVIIGGGWLIARDRAGVIGGSTATSTDEMAEVADASTETTVAAPPGMPVAMPSPSPAAAEAPTTPASGENVTVEDQAAGNTVVVSEVNIKRPSWIAVRDTRGWYPGAKWLNASEKNVTIGLLRNTEAGKTYEVVIFIDDGDKQFSLHGGDMLVTSTQGAPVSSTFTAQ
jgi:hypothetical protein